ncbi:hypothetical protein LCGC14_1384940 [marine sediment metagenome]|uniref:Uncharacterized protein n=1 Tax=marine sediment metagenome TaxID=412755 RepID=A0A0F9K1L9_9ZZZZ
MKIDLSPYIDNEINIVAERLVKTGLWIREDICYLTCSLDHYTDNLPSIILSARILYYKEEMHDVAVPWMGLSITTQEGNLDTVITMLLNTLKEIGLKPFKDEDSYNLYFTIPKLHEGLISVTCYVNTHYGNGYWENHTL